MYDDLGSKLFEKICDTKEYYLTRTESQILNMYALDIVNKAMPAEIFESLLIKKQNFNFKCTKENELPEVFFFWYFY